MDIHIVVFAILYAYGIWNLQYVSLRMFIGNNVIMSSMHESNCWCHARASVYASLNLPNQTYLLVQVVVLTSIVQIQNEWQISKLL